MLRLGVVDRLDFKHRRIRPFGQSIGRVACAEGSKSDTDADLGIRFDRDADRVEATFGFGEIGPADADRGRRDPPAATLVRPDYPLSSS